MNVGPIVALLAPVAKWLLSEDGYGEWQRKRELGAAKTAALLALRDNDWPLVRARVDELERLSARP